MRLHVLRLLALLSSAGGPLYVYDLLVTGDLDYRVFAFCFAPVALMILGSLSFGDLPSARLSRLWVRLGLFGAVALVLVNGFTVACLLTRAPHPHQLLIIGGVVVGALTSALYILVARAFLNRVTPL